MTEAEPARIVLLDAPALSARRAELAALLMDAVAGGASVGFLADLTESEAEAAWRAVEGAVAAGETVAVAALSDGHAAGVVLLHLAPRANGRHRAEVARLLVHRSARRRGLGAALLDAAEAEAIRRGRTLLVLDTDADSAARQLYERQGWSLAGEIPAYAARPDGALAATAIFWKRL